MLTRNSRRCALPLVLVFASASQSDLASAADDSSQPASRGLTAPAPNELTAPATNEQIAAMIRELSDPSYEKRTHATRRLCAIGAPAIAQLTLAAAGETTEAALRAKAVLSVVDRVLFAGVDIGLKLSKSNISWNEPVDLILILTNRSPHAARIPFELDLARRKQLTADAEQVGDMLDVGEYLRIRHEDGQEIELTIDDIGADEQVVAVVHDRLSGGPTAILNPGQETTLIVRAMNRGWARYRLLDRGDYTISLEYVPGWDDAVLAARRVGRVVSNTATLTVDRAAPDTISRSGDEASLSLRLAGREVIAAITNRTDQAMHVNANFGVSAPFAEGAWVWNSDFARREVPIRGKPGSSWHDFDPARFVKVEAGESIDLVRVDIKELRKILTDAGADLSAAESTVFFSYMNPCNRQWQLRHGAALFGNSEAPKCFRTFLPRRVLSTRDASNRLKASELQ